MKMYRFKKNALYKAPVMHREYTENTLHKVQATHLEDKNYPVIFTIKKGEIH